MLEDYESGIRRKPSRHVLGRMRWILLASVVVNLFLFYKYWSNNTKIMILEQSNKKLSNQLTTEHKQIEHYKKQTMMTEDRRTDCEKRSSEINDKAGECQLRHKDCSDTLESTSAKLMEMNQNVKTLTQDKEDLEGELEKKATELDSVKEQVARLQNEIQQFERNQHNNPIVRQQSQQPQVVKHEVAEQSKHQTEEPQNQKTVKEGEIQHINTINTPKQEQRFVKEHEVKRDADEGVLEMVKDEGDQLISKSEKDQSVAAEATAFIECDFSETSLDKGKCNYMMEPSELHWGFGRPSFLKEYSEQCLYIDDSASGLGQRRSLIFQEIQTDKCLQLTINATIVGGGQLSVRDNDKAYEVTMKSTNSELPVWESKSFNLNAAPTHAIEITGIVNKYGGVALTKVLLTEGECGPDIKSEVEFDDKVDEHDKEMMDDIV